MVGTSASRRSRGRAARRRFPVAACAGPRSRSGADEAVDGAAPAGLSPPNGLGEQRGLPGPAAAVDDERRPIRALEVALDLAQDVLAPDEEPDPLVGELAVGAPFGIELLVRPDPRLAARLGRRLVGLWPARARSPPPGPSGHRPPAVRGGLATARCARCPSRRGSAFRGSSPSLPFRASRRVWSGSAKIRIGHSSPACSGSGSPMPSSSSRTKQEARPAGAPISSAPATISCSVADVRRRGGGARRSPASSAAFCSAACSGLPPPPTPRPARRSRRRDGRAGSSRS